MRRFFASVFEVIEVAVVALGAVFIIRSFLVQPFLVNGVSMMPNFSHGDYLLIDEITYRFRTPQRGEVAVFHYPNDTSTYFIKRIVGVAGDRIHINSNRITIVNEEYPEGKTLEEPYLPPGTVTALRPGSQDEFVLRDGEFLVLGDNRSYSFDSRDWGLLSRKEIVGLARLRLWPLSGFTVFAAPRYE